MARTTLVEALGRLLLEWRLRTAVGRQPASHPKSIPQPRRSPMNLSIFNGYKTYVVAAAMLIAGLAQLLGVELPTFDGQSAGQLLMEGLAILFLRRGMKG